MLTDPPACTLQSAAQRGGVELWWQGVAATPTKALSGMAELWRVVLNAQVCASVCACVFVCVSGHMCGYVFWSVQSSWCTEVGRNCFVYRFLVR